MSVVVAGEKYLLPKLEAEALESLFTEIGAIKATCERTCNATPLLEAIKLLSSHKDHDASFDEQIKTIAQEFLRNLLPLEDFRSFLDSDEGKQSLGYIMTQATILGTKILEAQGWDATDAENIVISTCSFCDTF